MFKASLFIFEKEYPLLSYELGSYQPADEEGLPNCRVVLEKIHFSYQSIKDDSAFLSATISGETLVSGYIRVYKRDGFQKFIDYEFANAYVLSFRETFDSTGEEPMTTYITLGAGIIKRDAHTFENHWNPNDPYEEGEVTTIEEAEPEVLEIYYTDLQDNKQPEPTTGEEVFLVLKTKNAVGETIDIDLSNNARDFMYNGEILEDDMLRDFEITSDLHKIKLRVIVQQEGEFDSIQN